MCFSQHYSMDISIYPWAQKRVHLKILLQNLLIKGKIYVRHYKIYGSKKLYKKRFFQGITPVFKKNNPLLVKNYRHVSVLPIASKIFKRIMQKQIIDFINQYLLLCYVDTEKASLHKRFCFISLKNGTLCLIKK